MVNKNKIMLKMSFREIRNNIKQYIALILISFLAMTLYIGLSSNAKSLAYRVNKIYNDGNIADIFTYVNETSSEDKYNLEQIEGVSKVETRINALTDIDGKNGSLIITNKYNVLSKYSEIVMGQEGFMIDSYYQEMFHKNLNDDIALKLPFSLETLYNSFVDFYASLHNVSSSYVNTLLTSYLKNDVSNPFLNANFVISCKVTGFMKHPEAVEVSSTRRLTVLANSNYINEVIISFLEDMIKDNFQTNDVLNEILYYLSKFDIDNYTNQYLIKINDKANVKDVNNEIKQYFQSSTNYITSLTIDSLPFTITLENDISQADKLSIVFPLIFFIVALLVVLTTLSQLVYRSSKDISVLKSLGLDKKSILIHYMFIGGILSFIGCFLGSVIGPLIIPLIMNNKYKIMYLLPELRIIFPFDKIIICTLAFCLLSVLCSFLVTFKEVNNKNVIYQINSKLKVSKSKKYKTNSIFNFSLKMAKRNIFCNISRSLMVIFGVMGCTSLLVSGFGIMDTINYGINLDYGKHNVNDLSLTYGEDINVKNKIYNSNVKDKILYYEEYMNVNASLINGDNSLDTYIIVLNENLNYSYDFATNINTGMALSKNIASSLNLNVNDEVMMLINGMKHVCVIDYIFESSVLTKPYILLKNMDYLNFSPNGANIILKDNYSEDEVKEDIENLNLSLSSIVTNKENRKRIKNILSSVEVMTNTIKVFAILLSVVVTYNLALLNYNDHKRNMATLKVIGAKDKEIVFSLVLEIFILSLIGSVLGLFLGYPLLYILLNVNQTPLFNFLYHIFNKTYFISYFISIGSTLIVNLLLSRLIKKIDAVSALKCVE